MKAMIHITKEVETVDEASDYYKWIKSMFQEYDTVHVNGQVTVKFSPSHPEGTPEEGPKP